MKQRTFLLPNIFQRIGWILFISSIILLVASNLLFKSFEVFNPDRSPLATFVLLIILYISAFLVTLSKERLEDELTREIRYSSVVITACTGFIVYLIIMIFFQSGAILGLMPKYKIGFTSYVNPVTMFILYILVFRSRIIINKMRLKNEE